MQINIDYKGKDYNEIKKIIDTAYKKVENFFFDALVKHLNYQVVLFGLGCTSI